MAFVQHRSTTPKNDSRFLGIYKNTVTKCCVSQMKVIEIDKRLSGSMGVTREMPIEMEKLLDFFRVSSDDIREFILAVTGQMTHQPGQEIFEILQNFG